MSKYIKHKGSSQFFRTAPRGWYKWFLHNDKYTKIYVFTKGLYIIFWSQDHIAYRYKNFNREEFKRQLKIRGTDLYKAVYND